VAGAGPPRASEGHEWSAKTARGAPANLVGVAKALRQATLGAPSAAQLVAAE
jgi:hypothetical protein